MTTADAGTLSSSPLCQGTIFYYNISIIKMQHIYKHRVVLRTWYLWFGVAITVIKMS